MKSFQKIFCALIICAGSYWVTFWRFFVSGGANNHDLQLLIDGTVATPYQYRVLIPWMERYMTTMLSALHIKTPPIYVPSQLIFPNVVEAHVVFFLECFICIALVFYFWHYMNLLLRNETSGFLFSLLLLAIIPFHYMYSGFPIWYPYDTSAILVLTLGLIFLLEKKTAAFYILLFIGTFNKETTVFLILLHVLVNWKTGERAWIVKHFCLQSALWIIAKVILFFVYRENSGELFQIHLWGNIKSIIFLKDSAVAGGLYGFVILASLFGFLWLPVLLFRRLVNNDFVSSTLMVVPFFVAGMMFVGIITELRIFGELIPIVLSAFSLIAAESIRKTQAT
ncbi:MAG TPA: hypothetical protein VL633_12555 [Bacteroidota bacterium]|nr:hypothetical protein [Bacteroidota bacterium]